MKAVITKQVSNAYNYSRDKELVSAYSVIGTLNGEKREIVCCRAYMGRSASASVVYASLWVHAGNLCTSGKGSAGGYGYHKTSAAIGGAISNAGIELYGDVYGGSSWNHAENRAYTPKELAANRRKANKSRAYIGGVGDGAVRDALLAIAKAAGGRNLFLVSH